MELHFQYDHKHHIHDVDSKDGIIANYPMNSLVENSENNRDLTAGNNASIASVDGKKALKLNGSESYVNSPVATAGLGNDLRVKVKRTSSSSEEHNLSYHSILQMLHQSFAYHLQE